jgi:DNA polymerase III subunit delta'
MFATALPPMTTPPEPSSTRFVGVRGHEQAQERLARAIARRQLHHGLVFVGPKGVGKAALARGLACALHCEDAAGVGCGRCSTCRRILAGHHAGVEWVTPDPAAASGKIKVETARELANRLQLAPFEGPAHLVVFDPADALTEQAFNALLKTLEEPRPGVHFVMLTTGLDRLLPTIASRCMPVRLGRLKASDVRAIVEDELGRRREAGDETATRADDARLELAVRLSEGSAGLAVELALDPSLDDALSLLARAVEATERGPSGIFGGEKSPLWAAWGQAIGPSKTGRPARERAVAARTAELWLLHLRESMRGGSGLPGVPPSPGAADRRTRVQHLDRLQAFLEGLDRNPNVRLSLEQTLLELSG